MAQRDRPRSLTLLPRPRPVEGTRSRYRILLAILAVHGVVIAASGLARVYHTQRAGEATEWAWVAINGGFVLATATVLLIAWRAADHDRDRAEALRNQVAKENERRQQALRLNDNVVQDLVMAKMAAEMGDDERSLAALSEALDHARQIISDLIGETEGASIRPGSLRLDRTPRRVVPA